jgi:hypothetical protein
MDICARFISIQGKYTSKNFLVLGIRENYGFNKRGNRNLCPFGQTLYLLVWFESRFKKIVLLNN